MRTAWQTAHPGKISVPRNGPRSTRLETSLMCGIAQKERFATHILLNPGPDPCPVTPGVRQEDAMTKPFLRTLTMNHRQDRFAPCLLTMAALLSTAAIQGAWAQTAPALGTATSFAVLGGAGVTCTTSSVAGNVGSLLTVTGFPPPTPALCTLVGSVHAADAAATTAFNDIFMVGHAYDMLKAMTCQHLLTGIPLGGLRLEPGVYCFGTTASLTTGTLTLDGRGNSNAVWVFQVGTAITTGTASVVMADGGQACNVFWQLGTAATIGTGTAFLGNILAGSAITFTGVNSSLVGRALAKTAVTMTGTNISIGNCGGTPPPSCDKDREHKKNDKPDKQNCDADHHGDQDGDDDDDDDDDDDHGDGHGQHDHGGK
jgi:hypothetical protein